MNRSFIAIVSTAACAALAPHAFADIPDGDVHLTIENGRLTTGLIAEDDSYVIPGIRVFYGELGVDIPNTAADPGFKADPGAFAPGVSVGFNFTGALRVWNGTDFSTIAGSTMTMSLGPASFTTPASDVFTPGFSVADEADGSFHHHPTFVLNAPASDGIYLLDISLTATGSDPAAPIWMLWNQNEDADTAQAAYDFASATVPAPAGLAPLAGGLVLLARRRRARVI
jgi:hypothetical protein